MTTQRTILIALCLLIMAGIYYNRVSPATTCRHEILSSAFAAVSVLWMQGHPAH
jgi:hypothetical protein